MPTVSPGSLVARSEAEVAVRNVALAELAKEHNKTDNPNNPAESQRLRLIVFLRSVPL